MRRITICYFIVIQFVLLIDNTKQSKIKLGVNAFKTIGNVMKIPQIKTFNTIKKPMGVLYKKKNNIKKVEFASVQHRALNIDKGAENQLKSFRKVASEPVKNLEKGAINKQKVPQGVKGIDKLLKPEGRTGIFNRSTSWIKTKGVQKLKYLAYNYGPLVTFMTAWVGMVAYSEMQLVPNNDFDESILTADQKPKKTNLKFFDIAANLLADEFKGKYTDYVFHEADIKHVIKRANDYGVDKFLLSGGYLEKMVETVELCKERSDCWTTVGVNPSRVGEIDKYKGNEKAYYEMLENTITKQGKKCSAIGECGLDYARQEFTDKELQKKHFLKHFDLAEKFKLPMYFHSRDATADFVRMVKENRHRFSDGVVHSFGGKEEELNDILNMGLYVSLNARSLKNKADIEAAKKIPLNRIMLETDSPWCEVRNSHASMKYVKTRIAHVNNKKNWCPEKMVKGRNEPCKIIQVCEIVAALKGIPEEELAKAAYENSCKVFVRD